jgi:hypothetical protein
MQADPDGVPGLAILPRQLPVLGGQGRGEKVDEQLVDAFGLVVMHPVRGVGQALDTVSWVPQLRSALIGESAV